MDRHTVGMCSLLHPGALQLVLLACMRAAFAGDTLVLMRRTSVSQSRADVSSAGKVRQAGQQSGGVCWLAAVHLCVWCCRCKETGESKVILTTLCGHGHFDMSSYAKYLDGGLQVGRRATGCLVSDLGTLFVATACRSAWARCKDRP